MRLQQLTGSLSSAESQVSSLDAGSLQDVMDHLASGIKRLHGGSAYHSQEAGRFSQDIRMDNKLQVDQGAIVSVHLHGSGTLTAEGAADLRSTLNVGAEATLASAKISDLTAGRVPFAGTDGAIEDVAGLEWDGAHFSAASVKVADLTAGRVIIAGTDGDLADDSAMTYDAATDVLTVNGSTFSDDVVIAGNLTVQGDQIVANVTELIVEDKLVVFASGASGALLDGAGFALGSDAGAKSFKYVQASDEWRASVDVDAPAYTADNLLADTDNKMLVSDNDGKIVPADMATFVAGTVSQVSVADDGDGTITLSLPQDIHTGAEPQFAAVTGSNLTQDKLMKAGPGGVMISADLFSFVTETANQVLIADDGDGTITFSAPQDIHSGASPEFAALNIGSAHDILDDGSGNLKLETSGELLLSGADGQYELAESGDRAQFVSLFDANISIIGAINSLKGAADSTAKYVETPGAVSVGASVSFTGLNRGDLGASADEQDARLDIYVNGQLLTRGASADYEFGTATSDIDFNFDLEADDVVVAIVR